MYGEQYDVIGAAVPVRKDCVTRSSHVLCIVKVKHVVSVRMVHVR